MSRQRPILWCALGILQTVMLLSASFAADEKDGPVYTDPKDAGPDYALQGEFKGALPADDNRTWGAQVIALGNGKFRLVGYPDGLPAMASCQATRFAYQKVNAMATKLCSKTTSSRSR